MLSCQVKLSKLLANSVDSDQAAPQEQPDLGLLCLLKNFWQNICSYMVYDNNLRLTNGVFYQYFFNLLTLITIFQFYIAYFLKNYNHSAKLYTIKISIHDFFDNFNYGQL